MGGETILSQVLFFRGERLQKGLQSINVVELESRSASVCVIYQRYIGNRSNVGSSSSSFFNSVVPSAGVLGVEVVQKRKPDSASVSSIVSSTAKRSKVKAAGTGRVVSTENAEKEDDCEVAVVQVVVSIFLFFKSQAIFMIVMELVANESNASLKLVANE